MDKIIGNFLSQPNRDFPLDCETLDTIQQQINLALALGLQLGDRIILSGCALTGTTRTEGFVFLRTNDAPCGEVLRFEGGSNSLGAYIKTDQVAVNANGYDYPQAYTIRTLAPGLGEEHFNWDDFQTLPTLAQLADQIKQVKAQHQQDMAALTPSPLGFVELWSGGADSVPAGWALCDGRSLPQADYPALYAVLGTRYNTAPSQSGQPYTTPSGFFRLPDLRGRFIVGFSDTDNDYNIAQAGGAKKIILTEDAMPIHQHAMQDIVNLPNGSGEITSGNVMLAGEKCNAGGLSVSGLSKRAQTDKSQNIAQYIEHQTKPSGQEQPAPVENRPPYYTLAYVMRLQ